MHTYELKGKNGTWQLIAVRSRGRPRRTVLDKYPTYSEAKAMMEFLESQGGTYEPEGSEASSEEGPPPG